MVEKDTSEATGTFWEATDARSFSSEREKISSLSGLLSNSSGRKDLIYCFVQFLVMLGDNSIRQYI